MKELLWFGLLGLMLPRAVLAQSAFDGTWKLDQETAQIEAKPERYLLKGGWYDCKACEPPLHVKADGTEHKITGDPCFSTVSVKVIGERTVEETYKKDGRVVESSRMTISPDGNAATMDWSERCNAQGDLVAVKRLMKRVEPAPAGAHVISASWQLVRREQVTDNAFIATLRMDGDSFSFFDPAGQGYTAKLNGPEVPWHGGLSKQTVAVKQLGANSIEETSRQDGKIVEVVRYIVSADGKTMTISIENRAAGSTTTYTAKKQ